MAIIIRVESISIAFIIKGPLKVLSIPVVFLLVCAFCLHVILCDPPPVDGEGPQEIILELEAPEDDGILTDMKIVLELPAFEVCQIDNCNALCGTNDLEMSYCNKKNKKLCMCNPTYFYASDLEGSITVVDRKVSKHKNCSIACEKRKSYSRIWTKLDHTQHCLCLINRVTRTGITLCDEFTTVDLCKFYCQTDSAKCAFNGVCLCRKDWDPIFNLVLPHIRKEKPEDEEECSFQCSMYHHDFVGRLYDSKMDEPLIPGKNKTYKFREKFCLCGEWINSAHLLKSQEIVEQGFQLCKGLKCKRQCGMDEGICEPEFRRACLCPRENIIIGDHLWSRIPSGKEIKCHDTCLENNLEPRVIEWNPFFNPESQFLKPFYRSSIFQYIYDGKSCHCIRPERNMDQFRPCAQELCRILCGHLEAYCDEQTRRVCYCNTHKPIGGIGRRADPAEINCDIACRYGQFDSRVLDIKWEIPIEHWGAKHGKYCLCIRPVSPAGLRHCDPLNDPCPKLCSNQDAYCTQEKYCHCGIIKNILKNPMVRLGNGKEEDECGEKCRSWMWPMAIDFDNHPYIYDELLESCSSTKTCPTIDHSPWKISSPGALTVSIDANEQESTESNEKFCLCVKSNSVRYKPGSRMGMNMEPIRVSKTIPCVNNHTCVIVGNSIHIVA